MSQSVKSVDLHKVTHSYTERIRPHEPRSKHRKTYEEERAAALDAAGHKCWLCGKTLDELPEGIYLEAHHAVAEFHLKPVVDFGVMQEMFDSGKVDFYGLSKKLKGKPVTSIHDRRQLLILCGYCHRYEPTDNHNGGIHILDGAVWLSQEPIKKGYNLFKD